ncbi:uncharacterized protein LOC126898751 isoform X2 [Daktulosphaira vitifoliae]|uniref:uncharacterized protein LOC126898751 isoform X2 n=1 Tax=Daktulosphaira vitifoliae TaxID=58002 RepID=UPI0021AB0880|nr:uncharacterized protein LOC126898751 isoform X2 [Daktulosphaira vitifoliae]
MSQNMIGILKRITFVELVAFLFYLTVTFSSCLNTSLLLYKSCSPDVVPNSIGQKCQNENKAEHKVMQINTWKSIVVQILPMAITLMAGPWSDRHGNQRKVLMLISILGQLLSDFASLYSSWNWSKITPVATAMIQVLLSAFTGSSALFRGAVLSYIADVSDEHWRTYRYGLLICAEFSSGFVGMFIYGFIVESTGFNEAFILCIVLDIVALCVVMMFLKDNSGAYVKKSFFKDVVETLNLTKVFKDSCRVLSDSRPDNKRLILLLMVFVCGPLTSAPVTGTAMVMCIMSRLLEVSDAMIGIIASIFDLASELMFYYASKKWQLYLIPLLQIFLGAAISATYSISSKCVNINELGTMNSVKILFERLSNAITLLLYTLLYNLTLDTSPSSYYLMSVVFIALTIPLFIITNILTRMKRKEDQFAITYGTF